MSREIREIIPSLFSVFSSDEKVSRVLGVLKETGAYEAVIKSEGPLGLITVRDFLDVDQPSRTRIDRIWRATSSVPPTANVLEVAEKLVRNNIRAIPVVEAGNVIGIASQVDIITAMHDIQGLSGYPAKELVRSPIWSLDLDEGISNARRVMLDRGISHVPVVELGRLVGVVTAEEIVHTFITPASKTTLGERVGRRTSRFPGMVSGIMDPRPLTVSQEATVLEVVRGLKDQGKSACFMTEKGGRILGILTPRELLAPLLKFSAERELPVYIMGLSDEDFYERSIAEEKIRRIVGRSRRFRPDITEVSVRIKRSQSKGERTRYHLKGRALSADGQINAEAEGWDLLQVFDELIETLGKALRRSKPEAPRTRRRRSRR
ncbi:MAG: CBS domain-containing protein [Candidatus Bathyarchaeota archaeon]|nr:MAG: CBS domain-containing protein [Candidatus Bathyarchaeota archaeon]